VQRRFQLEQKSGKKGQQTKELRSKYWNASECIEWLNDNPITSEKDVSFLSETVVQLKSIFLESFGSTTGNCPVKKAWCLAWFHSLFATDSVPDRR
jgi:hypothetical protein